MSYIQHNINRYINKKGVLYLTELFGNWSYIYTLNLIYLVGIPVLLGIRSGEISQKKRDFHCKIRLLLKRSAARSGILSCWSFYGSDQGQDFTEIFTASGVG